MPGHMDASKYKQVVLGLIFLKYVNDVFTELHDRLKAKAGADRADRDEYTAENVFWVPQDARWEKIQATPKVPGSCKVIDYAMVAIEAEIPALVRSAG